MTESIVASITHSLTSVIPAEVIIFIVSLMPILELRGGLIAASLLKLNLLYAFPICVLGNLLPIPFILLFIDKIFFFLKKTRMRKLVEHFEKKQKPKAPLLKNTENGACLFLSRCHSPEQVVGQAL